MDAAYLRTLIDGAMDARRQLTEAEERHAASRKQLETAESRLTRETTNLDMALSGAQVIYGHVVVRVDSLPKRTLVVVPLVKLPEVKPAEPCEPESLPQQVFLPNGFVAAATVNPAGVHEINATAIPQNVPIGLPDAVPAPKVPTSGGTIPHTHKGRK